MSTESWILLYAAGIGYHRPLSRLPSWVPDWTCSSSPTDLGVRAHGASGFGFDHFRAGGRSAQSLLIDKETRSITLTGRILDTVSTVFNPRPRPNWARRGSGDYLPWPEFLTWLKEVFCVISPNTLYPTGERFFPQVLGRTLVMNMNEQRGLVTEDVGSQLLDCCKVDVWNTANLSAEEDVVIDREVAVMAMERTISVETPHKTSTQQSTVGDSTSDPRPGLSDSVARPRSLRSIPQSAEKYLIAMNSLTSGRRLFTTKTGYFGQGPPLLLPGDLICLLNRLEVPFSIRRREIEEGDGGYALVGECYVDGIMFGEGLEMGKRRRLHCFEGRFVFESGSLAELLLEEGSCVEQFLVV